jgi:hypothetical protein
MPDEEPFLRFYYFALTYLIEDKTVLKQRPILFFSLAISTVGITTNYIGIQRSIKSAIKHIG